MIKKRVSLHVALCAVHAVRFKVKVKVCLRATNSGIWLYDSVIKQVSGNVFTAALIS